jgi:Phage head-tail joining protein
MTVRAGMRERVTVHRAPVTTDEYGNETGRDWANAVTVAVVRGSLQTGRDTLRNTAQTGLRLTNETVLYLTPYDYDPSDRYTVAGRVYDVTELADSRWNGTSHHLRATVVPLRTLTEAE